MASHKSNKFKQIIVIIVGSGTKLTKAILQYYVQKSSPTNFNPYPWTLDHFLYENQTHILSTRTGKRKQRVFFPGFGKSTNLELWDLHMYCFVLTELCPLADAVRQDINNLKDLRNKVCHISKPVIPDHIYDTYIDRIKGVVQRCTQVIGDKDLEVELFQYIEDVESGTTDQPDAETQLREWCNLGKQLREILSDLGPAHEKILWKLETLLRGSARDMIETIRIPESEVEIIVKNCTREKEAELSNILVQHFCEYIGHETKVNLELPDELRESILEAIRKAMATLLVGGRTLNSVERSSVILKIQCPSFRSLRELFESCSVLDIPFESLEKEIRKIQGCESAKLQVVIFEETFWNCVNEMAKACEQYIEGHSSLYRATKEPVESQMHGRLIYVRHDETKEKSSVNLRIKSNSPEHSWYLREVFKNGTAEERMKQLEEAVTKALNLPKLRLEAKLTEGTAICTSESNDEQHVVIAIDFGTTYSGYAYQTVEGYRSGIMNISISSWSEGGSLESYKTPSCILFNMDYQFDSFGKEAENKYNKLVEENHHYNWFFFKNFKTLLYTAENLSRRTILEDVNGASMLAIDVFTKTIEYLKFHAQCKLLGLPIDENSIKWVITVPAIWNDAAKQFMRETAIRAGIPTERLTLSLEPEAASLFTRHANVENTSDDTREEIIDLKTGDKYIIVDVGGGTVDMTVHQIEDGNYLRELAKGNGGQLGGEKVNDKFCDFLQEVIGKDLILRANVTHHADYLYLIQQFEILKRTVSPSMYGFQKFTLPLSIRNSYKSVHGEDFDTATTIPEHFRGKVEFERDDLLVDSNIVKGFFTEVCESICDKVDEMLRSVREEHVCTIIMVGGFSESPMLQDAFRKRFQEPNFRIIIPSEPGLAVLKGAVLFGHNPRIVSTRVCKKTYGIRSYKHFEPAIDPAEKRVEVGDLVLCKDSFSKHATRGQKFKVDEMTAAEEYIPDSADSTSITLEIFTSERKHPMYTDEKDCRKNGEMKVELLEKEGGLDRPVMVYFMFGDTELKILAIEKHTGNKTTAIVDFL